MEPTSTSPTLITAIFVQAKVPSRSLYSTCNFLIAKKERNLIPKTASKK